MISSYLIGNSAFYCPMRNIGISTCFGLNALSKDTQLNQDLCYKPQLLNPSLKRAKPMPSSTRLSNLRHHILTMCTEGQPFLSLLVHVSNWYRYPQQSSFRLLSFRAWASQDLNPSTILISNFNLASFPILVCVFLASVKVGEILSQAL
jgi:hypothetical protein